ncbi:hypothetical protein BVH03_23075 [Pseudomonas sp. PA15(2017)]|uniref:hypothetical protein n=1 Tax=Pseudomonas sp. PA15(2017) TaxID=1932111 RepID=UPI00095DF4CC|nr:hypothetical protein [Pseudomonas sp. PA15(2017)]OLU23112.1 hypothetical protein BVH03_23075 [Pseudomonas sp. PA15(2017)]
MSERPPLPRTGDDMDLPEGMTCGDCRHARRCIAMFGHIAEDLSCDWSPSRFQAATVQQSPACAGYTKPLTSRGAA